ncbi:MAG: exodeoxyribonuclease VII small subunit [Chthonomonadales bacterium]|nr:exodeoxyribonuclease VII small subunit [Chthonomonadales bacterium]
MKKTRPADEPPATYGEALRELEAIVARIEQGDVDVDDLAQSVKRAALLVRTCRTRLRATQQEVEAALEGVDAAGGATYGAAPGNGAASGGVDDPGASFDDE